jgi:HD-GYP domain-containing protein (c-di-GMP phosphodiesterase class II)
MEKQEKQGSEQQIQRCCLRLKKNVVLPHQLVPKLEELMAIPELKSLESDPNPKLAIISKDWTFRGLVTSIFSYLNELEEKKLVDNDFFRHSTSVTEISLRIAREIKLELRIAKEHEEETAKRRGQKVEEKKVNSELEEINLEDLLLSTLLHDIGKQVIPKKLWDIPKGVMKDEDWATIKSHVIYSSKFARRLLQGILDDKKVEDISNFIHFHHERNDGRGYPHLLRGDEIYLCSKIMAVADVYDALSNPRPYRPPSDNRTKKEALDFMRSEREAKQYDKRILDAFIETIRKRTSTHV